MKKWNSERSDFIGCGDRVGGDHVEPLLQKLPGKKALTVGNEVALGVNEDGEGE